MLRGQEDLHIICNLCTTSSRYKVRFLVSLFTVNGQSLLLGSYISSLGKNQKRTKCQVTLIFGISLGIMVVGNV